jgi:hypothetical protein
MSNEILKVPTTEMKKKKSPATLNNHSQQHTNHQREYPKYRRGSPKAMTSRREHCTCAVVARSTDLIFSVRG